MTRALMRSVLAGIVFGVIAAASLFSPAALATSRLPAAMAAIAVPLAVPPAPPAAALAPPVERPLAERPLAERALATPPLPAPTPAAERASADTSGAAKIILAATKAKPKPHLKAKASARHKAKKKLRRYSRPPVTFAAAATRPQTRDVWAMVRDGRLRFADAAQPLYGHAAFQQAVAAARGPAAKTAAPPRWVPPPLQAKRTPIQAQDRRLVSETLVYYTGRNRGERPGGNGTPRPTAPLGCRRPANRWSPVFWRAFRAPANEDEALRRAA